MSENNQVALLRFSVFSSNLGPLDNVIKTSEAYKAMIETFISNEFATNMHKTMEALTNVAEYLDVAECGSVGTKSNAMILDILMQYQRLVRDADVALRKMRNKSHTALGNHVEAIEDFNNDEFGDALEEIADCKKLAMEIVTCLNELEKRTSELQNKAAECAIKLSEDSITEREELEKLKELQMKQKKDQKELEERAKQNQEALRKTREDLEKALKEEDKMYSREHKVRMVKTVLSPVTEIAKSVSNITTGIGKGIGKGLEVVSGIGKVFQKKDKTEDKESKEAKNDASSDSSDTKSPKEDMKLEENSKEKSEDNKIHQKIAENVMTTAKELRELSKKRRDALLADQVALAGLCEDLNHTPIKIGDKETAILMMKYTGVALKSIESAFGTMKHFWECQAVEMDNLEACSKKIEKVMKKVAREDPEQRDELKASLEQRIRESGTRWFAVFRQNHNAIQLLQPAIESIEEIIRNPSNLGSDGRPLPDEDVEEKLKEKVNKLSQKRPEKAAANMLEIEEIQ